MLIKRLIVLLLTAISILGPIQKACAQPMESDAGSSAAQQNPQPLGDESVPSMFFGSVDPEQAADYARRLQQLRLTDPYAEIAIPQATPTGSPTPVGMNSEPQIHTIQLADGSTYTGPITSSLAYQIYLQNKRHETGASGGPFLQFSTNYLGGLVNLIGLYMPLAIYLDSLIPPQCPPYASDTCITPTYGQGSTSQKGDLSVLAHAGYDYAPSIMWDGGKYKMWWCADGHLAGDRIYYSESSGSTPLQSGSWTTPTSVYVPSGVADDFDGDSTCDPSVVKVGGTYFMYYTALPTMDATPAYSFTTRIGAAYSTDGVSWTTYQSGGVDAPIIDTHVPNVSLPTHYGVGHPSVIFVDGYFYMSYDDSSGVATTQLVLRSPDPFFQNDVEEWQSGSWVDLNGSAPTTAYTYTGSVNVDWAYSPSTREFLVAIDGVGTPYSAYNESDARGTHSSLRVFSKDLTTEHLTPVVHVRAQWVDGPGIAKLSSGAILQDGSCSNHWIRVLRGGRDWNDPTGTFTAAQCEDNYSVSLGAHPTPSPPPSDAQRATAGGNMISCTELAYEGWDLATGLASGCRTNYSGPWINDDYDDDGISDPVVWRPSTGVWWTHRSSNGQQHGEQWGLSGDQPIFGADYDGDKVADPAVKRNGDFYVLPSSGVCPSPMVPLASTKGCFWASPWASSDVPLPGDYDGDGKADIAARDTSGGIHFVLSSGGSCPSHFGSATYSGVSGCSGTAGGSGDKPLVADYDGDFITDIAWHSPTFSQIWTYTSSGAGCPLHFASFGGACYTSMFASTDIPVTANFDSENKMDIMWWSPTSLTFYTWGTSSGSFVCPDNFTNASTYCYLSSGASGDVPLAKRFNADKPADPTVWHPSTADWFVSRTGSATPPGNTWATATPTPYTYTTQWGLSTDKVEGLR